MNRRVFLKSGAAMAALSASLPASAADAMSKSSREFYELRLYRLRKGPKQKLWDDFYRDAVLPAMKRQGIGPVGVFSMIVGPDSPTMYVLVPHPNMESFAIASERMRSDAEFQKVGKEFLNAPATDPAYIRVESSLLQAIQGVPKIEVPPAALAGKPRIFELRTYESHSKQANKTKIEMFNKGELGIFRRTGLQPVFFGETIVGTGLPNLTYMLTFENLAAREKNWASFVGDSEWKQLSATPGYTDPEIVTNISNVLLRPAPYSQI